MKGSYNAVTQEASGEYSRVDYQEGRKNTLLTGGIAIAVLAVIGVIIWYVLSKVTSIVPDPVKTVTDAYTAGTTAVVKGSNSVTKDPLQAINVDGNPYPVKTNTLADYEVAKGRDYAPLQVPEYSTANWGGILQQLNPRSKVQWRAWAAIALDLMGVRIIFCGSSSVD